VRLEVAAAFLYRSDRSPAELRDGRVERAAELGLAGVAGKRARSLESLGDGVHERVENLPRYGMT